MTEDEVPPGRPLLLAVYNFSSAWFLVPQGTSIVAVILHQLHYQFGALPILAKIVWIYAIVLLGLSIAIYITRACLFPNHVVREIRRSVVEASCLSSAPIAFTSIVQMIPLQYGGGAELAAYVLWWISTAISIIGVIAVPYTQLKMRPSGIDHIPPSFLLPVISILTSATAGGIICNYSSFSVRLKVPVIIVSYMELGTGIALAICIDAIIVYHHFDQMYPEYDKAYQDMVLCGPFGQASAGLQVLGMAVSSSFGEYNRGTLLTQSAASPIAAVSQFAGILAWGFGTFWWLFAMLSILYTLYVQSGGWRNVRFSLSAWSLIFPWGVYTNGAVQLGTLMDSPAFYVWSTVLLLLLVIMWVGVHIFTLKGLLTGKILGLERGWRVPKSGHQTV
ncbi:putative malic acid transport protein [Aspergillus stella-maris]|uniref:putative malic acid transport protein n=1 Tax=Aspergillus stella-maris TaxID=1810926 RepID=UPI003CCD9ACC